MSLGNGPLFPYTSGENGDIFLDGLEPETALSQKWYLLIS